MTVERSNSLTTMQASLMTLVWWLHCADDERDEIKKPTLEMSSTISVLVISQSLQTRSVRENPHSYDSVFEARRCCWEPWIDYWRPPKRCPLSDEIIL